MMQKIATLLLLFICYQTKLVAQTITIQTIATLPHILGESSGVCFIAPNKLYSMNDSGGLNQIYEMDTLANLLRTITITNATNIDWEDIIHDDYNNIYVGDFGNNLNNRTDQVIYKIPNPSTFSGNSVMAEIIHFSYPDQTQFPPVPSLQNFDMEAMVWLNDSLYLFSKNRTNPFTGYCKLYSLPQDAGTYIATLRDSIYIGNSSQNQNWITSASLSAAKNHLVLLNEFKVIWFSCFNGSNFFDGQKIELYLPNISQKEGIAFKNENELYLTDEENPITGAPSQLYKINLSVYNNNPYVYFANDTIVCDGCSIAPDSSNGTLLWSTGASSTSINPVNSGWVTVTAIAANGCTQKDSVYIDLITAVKNEIQQNFSFKIIQVSSAQYNAIFNCHIGEIYQLNTYDITGNLITETKGISQSNTTSIPLKNVVDKKLFIIQLKTTAHQATQKLLVDFTQ
jgi:hypothetical protein